MRAKPFLNSWLLFGLIAGCAGSDAHTSPVEPTEAGGAAGAPADESGGPEAAGAAEETSSESPGGSSSATGVGGEGGAPEPPALTACGTPEAPHAWADWVMPNPASSGLPHPTSYRTSASFAQVTDNVTGLSWQREVPARTFDWADAKSYCSCLSLDGDDDWRLPSRIELASLVDFGKVDPSIDVEAFPDTASDNFWTSSEVGIDPGLIYLVFFLNGHTTYAASDYEYRVRCVRGVAPTTPKRYVVQNGVVQDVQTQLSWQQQPPSERYTWSAADGYCAGLELDGGGWRLPSINELQTLVDETQNPSIDLEAFPMTPSEYFWSSSPVIDDATRAWTAFFTNGSTYSFAAVSSRNVRCVR